MFTYRQILISIGRREQILLRCQAGIVTSTKNLFYERIPILILC